MADVVTIELAKLHLQGNHGWYDEEALLNAPFDVSFSASLPVAAPIRHVSETVDYVRLYEIICSTFSERELLLETVAQKIIDRIATAFPQLENLQLRIVKLNPLIESFTGTVGILYQRNLK